MGYSRSLDFTSCLVLNDQIHWSPLTRENLFAHSFDTETRSGRIRAYLCVTLRSPDQSVASQVLGDNGLCGIVRITASNFARDHSRCGTYTYRQPL
jgi:hypothetical protein